MKLLNIRKSLLHLTLTGLALLTGVSSTLAQSDKSLLYKIEGEDIKTSYLYGTIHVLPQKDFELKDKVKTAFNNAELVVLELDMDDPGMQIEMVSNAMMEGDESLNKLLGAEYYAKLDSVLKETMGIGVAPFNKWKPFMVSSMLLMKYVGEQPASFEGTFVQMAKSADKEILGLESVSEQLEIFDNIPYQDQADDIVDMLDNPDGMQDLYAEMVKVYKDEDIAEMYNMMDAYYEGDAEAMNLMLHTRNKNWIPKIAQFAKDKSTFFGVGAGHLGGDEGVISLLKEAGYTITPIVEE